MKKLFMVAGLALAVSVAVAEVVTLKVQVDLKAVDSIAFDVSKGRDALAEVLYDYCQKPPKKVLNALKKARAFNGELSIGFHNPQNPLGAEFMSHTAHCEFDKAKGYTLSKMNGYNVVRPDLGREVIIEGISESLILYGMPYGAWSDLEKFAELQAEQKKNRKDKK